METRNVNRGTVNHELRHGVKTLGVGVLSSSKIQELRQGRDDGMVGLWEDT